MTRVPLDDEQRSDAGFTLVELLVYAVLAALVLSLVGTIVIQTVQTQARTASYSTATNEAQLAAGDISDRLRNASGVDAAAMTGTGQLLAARVAVAKTTGTGSTATTATTWQCVSWFYSIANKAIYRKISTTAAVAAPTTSSMSGWTRLVGGVSLPAGTGKTVPFDDASGTTSVSLNFNATTSGTARVRISTSAAVSTQAVTGTGPTACF